MLWELDRDADSPAMFSDDAYTWHAKELGAWYWDDMAQVHSQSPHAFAKNFRKIGRAHV